MVQGSLENSLDLGIRLAKSSDPEMFRRILRQAEFIYEFLTDKSSVTSGMRFLRKSRKSGNGLG